MSSVIFRYKLKKYARSKITDDVPELEEFDGLVKDLEMTFYNTHHLVITCDNVVQDNICLLDGSADRIQVLRHNDNMQFHIKHQVFARKFRLKFMHDSLETAINDCALCCKILSSYVVIKEANNAKDANVSAMINSKDGNIKIRKLGKALMNPLDTPLPMAYQYASVECNADADMKDFISICLSDSSFPAFVKKVERILKLNE